MREKLMPLRNCKSEGCIMGGILNLQTCDKFFFPCSLFPHITLLVVFNIPHILTSLYFLKNVQFKV